MNVTVEEAGLNTYIPTITEVRESYIKFKFKVKILTLIEERPMYKHMGALTHKLGRNTHGIHMPCGGE